jgi:uncharacterized protein YwqG
VGLARVETELLELALPSIRLVPGTGRSHLGGDAELPQDVDWPQRDGSPLALVAQLFLDELAPHDTEELLPRWGTLAFFYDAEDQPWGFDPADRAGSAVVFVPDGTERDLRTAPGERLGSFALDARAELTLPPFGSDLLAPLELDEREKDAYLDLLQELEGDASNRCLGFPDEIQDDMQLEAQLVTHGLYVGDPSGYEDPRAAELARGAASWRLLFQIDSHEELGMYWGDVGRIYYWIREQDLRSRSFDAAWLILQCT